MARALNAGPAFIPSREAEYAEIETYYRNLLDRTLPPDALEWEPVKIGPTWQWTDSGWLLPEATLGWGFLSWTGYWLNGKGGKPWLWTPEQTRVILWYFGIDPHTTDFLAHTYAYQRLKGHGKDPFAAGVAAGSLHAPIMFDHWEGDRPIGRDDPEAWTQIVAVSQEQTKNTMKLFPSLISREAQDYYGIQIGKQNIWSDGDRRQIEAVTASPLAIEGGRPHQIIRAETQNWNSSNGGHDMAGAMEGNAAKAGVDSPARILDIFNAFRPGEESVAEKAREAWELVQGDPDADYGVMWDSLEAPPDAPLTAEAAPSVVRSIAGDSIWLDTRPRGRIVKSILNPDNSPSESRRKWYNQITGTEDAWVDPRWVDKNTVSEAVLVEGDSIVMFGDGSKSGDDTGLVACRVTDGMLFTLHWQHPNAGQVVDRAAVDAAVEDAFDRYKVVAFFFDPSHAKTGDATGDEDRFWWPLVDKWHEKYSRRLRLHAVQGGARKHAVAFDMILPSSQQQFQPAVQQLADDLREGLAPHHGGKMLRLHMKHARRREGKFGPSVGKENRSSSKKVDLAICAIGARMLWRMYRLKTNTGSPGKGRVIVLD